MLLEEGIKEMELPTSDIHQFRNQLNHPNQHFSNFGSDRPGNSQKIVKVDKNMVISFSGDVSGCGHIRNIFWITYLNAVYSREGHLRLSNIPFFTYQHELLMQARTLFFPRTMSSAYAEAIKKYKQMQQRYGYKMVYDIDDFLWKDANDPEKKIDYNTGLMHLPQERIDTVMSIMSMMDTIVTSTEFLKNFIANDLGIKHTAIKVLPNCTQRYFWGPNERQSIEKRLEKPKFIYTGSSCHYDNNNKKLGDWDNAWKDFIIDNVKKDRIDFMCMGGLPWFFDEIKDKIRVVGWLNSWQYHIPVLDFKPDFSIAPLIPNYFNYCKSDIRYVESCAYGALFMGSTFTNGRPSPYDDTFVKFPDNCTVKDIEDRVFGELVEPDSYNKIIRDQYNWIEKEQRWMESRGYVNRLIDILG